MIVIIIVVAVLLAAVGARQRGRKHFGPYVPRPHSQRMPPARQALLALDVPARFSASVTLVTPVLPE